MKRGFKALAVLAALAVASAGPAAFAVCLDLGGFPVFQCADRAYFLPPPAGSGTVSGVFWQLGYGNKAVDLNQGTSGTGNAGATLFNGNDNGTFVPELIDAQTAIGNTTPPAGAFCLRNNNWGNNGIDGCCDNPRDAAQPFNKDGLLNPLFDVNAVLAYGYQPQDVPSNDWVQDSPMGVLIKESNNHFFAVAVIATDPRTGPADIRPGSYNFKYIGNGLPNPFDATKLNIIPWQRIPGDRDPSDSNTNLVRVMSFANPSDKLNSARILDLGWVGVTVYTDDSSRPSSNPTVSSGGMGTNAAEAGGLARYVVESQAISDPLHPYNLNPAGWSAVQTFFPPATSGQVTVPPDTCVRLHTYLGKNPQTTSTTVANCRLGLCGDLGVDVVSPPACVGGPLVSETPIVTADRGRGAVTVGIRMLELSVQRYDIFAVSNKGREQVGTVACKSCTSGTTETYSVTLDTKKVGGAKTIEVVAVGPNTTGKAAIK